MGDSSDARTEPSKRMNWIGAPQFFRLNQAARTIVDAYGVCVYLVGSALERRDFRDVDVRCILQDEEFDRLFPGEIRDGLAWANPRLSLLAVAISLYLSEASGLPVDFQFQRATHANVEYTGTRNAIGIFLLPPEKA